MSWPSASGSNREVDLDPLHGSEDSSVLCTPGAWGTGLGLAAVGFTQLKSWPVHSYISPRLNTLASLLSQFPADLNQKAASLKGTSNLLGAGTQEGDRGKGANSAVDSQAVPGPSGTRPAGSRR